MRILYLTHNVSWTGGGIFFTAYHQGRYLAARGHEVTLLCISPRSRWGFKEYVSEGVRIVETPDLLRGKARTGWDLWNILARIIYLKDKRYDIIHGYESRPAVAVPALYLRCILNIPLILTWADWFGRGGKGSERGRYLKLIMGPMETFCEEYFYPRADRCVIMGEPLIERAISLGISQNRILNLLHGCDPGRFLTISIAEARNKLPNISQADFILGYLGVLRPSSATLLFEAFRLLKQSLNTPVRLVLIGNHKLKLADFIPDDLRNDVIETGWVSYEEVSLYLAASDILLLPLKKAVATDNVWPSKLNDYLAAGRSILATEMRILVPFFEKYGVGTLTKDTPAAFAEGCLKLAGDKTLRNCFGTNARAVADGDLSWETLVARLEKFYFDLSAADV